MTYFHTSNPANRDAIATEGLVPRVGDCYAAHYEDEDTPAETLRPAVFLAHGEDSIFWSTYDDDLYEVDTTGLALEREEEGMNWFLCFETIPPSKLKLFHAGTGECLLRAAQAACVETSEPLSKDPTKEHSGVAS